MDDLKHFLQIIQFSSESWFLLQHIHTIEAIDSVTEQPYLDYGVLVS